MTIANCVLMRKPSCFFERARAWNQTASYYATQDT
jgi:hypothetical protein